MTSGEVRAPIPKIPDPKDIHPMFFVEITNKSIFTAVIVQ